MDNKQIINGKTHFKNNKNEYILGKYEKEMGLYELFKKYIKRDVEKVHNEKGQPQKPSNQNIERIHNSTEKHILQIQKRQEHSCVTELVGMCNIKEQDIINVKSCDDDDIICLSDEKKIICKKKMM